MQQVRPLQAVLGSGRMHSAGTALERPPRRSPGSFTVARRAGLPPPPLRQVVLSRHPAQCPLLRPAPLRPSPQVAKALLEPALKAGAVAPPAPPQVSATNLCDKCIAKLLHFRCGGWGGGPAPHLALSSHLLGEEKGERGRPIKLSWHFAVVVLPPFKGRYCLPSCPAKGQHAPSPVWLAFNCSRLLSPRPHLLCTLDRPAPARWRRLLAGKRRSRLGSRARWPPSAAPPGPAGCLRCLTSTWTEW